MNASIRDIVRHTKWKFCDIVKNSIFIYLCPFFNSFRFSNIFYMILARVALDPWVFFFILRFCQVVYKIMKMFSPWLSLLGVYSLFFNLILYSLFFLSLTRIISFSHSSSSFLSFIFLCVSMSDLSLIFFVILFDCYSFSFIHCCHFEFLSVSLESKEMAEG